MKKNYVLFFSLIGIVLISIGIFSVTLLKDSSTRSKDQSTSEKQPTSQTSDSKQIESSQELESKSSGVKSRSNLKNN